MAFVEVKNSLHLLKRMTVKLQKRDNDITVAYNMIEETRMKIECLQWRSNSGGRGGHGHPKFYGRS